MKNVYWMLSITVSLISLAVQTTCAKPMDKVSWISDGKPQPASDEACYADDPAPLFKKTFNVQKDVQSAQLHIVVRASSTLFIYVLISVASQVAPVTVASRSKPMLSVTTVFVATSRKVLPRAVMCTFERAGPISSAFVAGSEFAPI